MIDVALAVLLQASGPVAEPPPSTPASETAPETVEKKDKPKMVCRFEYPTGSRLKRERVCHEQGSDEQQDKTKLQRELDRQGDVLQPGPVLGN